MKGYLVAHASFGHGKVADVTAGGLSVAFVNRGDAPVSFARTSLGGVLRRARLAPEDLALGPQGLCIVQSSAPSGDPSEARRYVVRYEDGLTETASEVDLVPVSSAGAATPVGTLAGNEAGSYAAFAARERFAAALARHAGQAGGLRALLSSRADLHAHQAFVAGTVVLDPRRRYVLADEVGLGKTIEAGVVIHDLLARRPQARVLVLAPGPLVRQWLTEIAVSFGGQDFRLADLHPPAAVPVRRWPRLIVSTKLAVGDLRDALVDAPWDMVVIDEAHHLVDQPILFRVARRLAENARDLLLLSAIPARRRETEFLRLLALLEPARYGSEIDGAAAGAIRDRFVRLYAAQETIGRRVNRLTAEIDLLPSGEASASDVLDKAGRLADLPVVRDDAAVLSALEAVRSAAAADGDAGAVIEPALALRRTVVDRFRIHRRILRNRRERLVAEDRLTPTRRRAEEHFYEPDQIELEVVEAVENVVGRAAAGGLAADIARPLAHAAFQALASPEGILGLLDELGRDDPDADVEDHEVESLNAALGPGYVARDRLAAVLRAKAGPFLDPVALAGARRAAQVWARSSGSRSRERAVVDLVKSRLGAGRAKILVFAGYPGFANACATALRRATGRTATAVFTHDMDDAQKEESARAFFSNPKTQVLVSDECGGEGRNFQHAEEIVHADLPWQVGLIEQRIGRLDRLGRTDPDVPSLVVVNAAAVEAGLAHCLGGEGLGVFVASLSGAEFALRDLQDAIVDAALAGCSDGTGADALRALGSNLRARVEEERARGEGEALLDEASFQADAAARFLKPPDDDLEAEVEAAFIGYFRRIAKAGSARPHSDDRTPQGLWAFHPDDVGEGGLPDLRRTPDGGTARRVGTFRRPVARARRDVEFLAPGNPLFDAVAASLRTRVAGRSYAVGFVAPGRPRETVIEFAMTLRPDMDRLAKHPGLANQAEALVGTRRRSVVFPLGSYKAVNEAPYLEWRSRCRPEHKGRIWDDLPPVRLASLVASVVSDWPDYLRNAGDRARLYARAAFQPRMAVLAAAEEIRIRDLVRQIDAEGAGNDLDLAAREELDGLDRYLKAVAGWAVELDAVGVLAVNP